MTFDEMRAKYDAFGAFVSWNTVSDEILQNRVPDIFPTICSCGSEIIMNGNKTEITCCDPRCYIKCGEALSELFDRYGIKGVGPATCSTVYNALKHHDKYLKESDQPGLFKTDSYVEVLSIPYDRYPASINSYESTRDFYRAVIQVLQSETTFAGLVQRLALPELNTSALNLFEGINSIVELLDTIQADGGIARFCAKRGRYAPMLHYWLKLSLIDIAQANVLTANNIRRQGLRTLEIVLTGRLYLNNNPITKAEFVTYCNNLSKLEDGTQLIEIKDTKARVNAPYIVYSVPSNDASQVEGRARGSIIDFDGVERKVLLTTEEFVEVLKLRIEALKREYYALKEEINSCNTQTETMNSF